MAEPGFIPLLSVQFCRLNVFVFLAAIPGNNFKFFTIVQPDHALLKCRTTDVINRKPWRDRIKTQLGKYHKCRHATAVLITRNAHQVVAEPLVKQGAYPFLCFPGFTGVIIQVRYVEAGFVGHGELPHVSRMVRQLSKELKLTLSQRLGKHGVKAGNKSFPSAHQPDQVGDAMLHIPPVYPGIVLAIIVSRPQSTRKYITERLDEFPPAVPGMEKPGLRIEKMTVIQGLLRIIVIILIFS